APCHSTASIMSSHRIRPHTQCADPPTRHTGDVALIRRETMQPIHARIIEGNPSLEGSTAPIVLEVDDPDSVAQRCWDAGLTVRVHQDETGRAPVSVIDPFGRRVDLVPRATPTRTAREATP